MEARGLATKSELRNLVDGEIKAIIAESGMRIAEGKRFRRELKKLRTMEKRRKALGLVPGSSETQLAAEEARLAGVAAAKLAEVRNSNNSIN